ncbi:MAG TPA: chorismate synthase [Candidatus Magasanikbacteria bacterium]|nr:MAG: chorismate synthase [Candidatus Magasanikbacteria bacterium RIFOXYC2_FULL_39_8]HAT03461.1 chorismate synthase [Candidatus Magasanikbacteria bacterium]
MSNIFGNIFKITTFGESHGVGVGVVIDGCPAGLEITREDIQKELDRRRPGQSNLTSQRKEKDQVEILSGIFDGKTLGTPIALLIRNGDAQSVSYEGIKDTYRPGHADYVYDMKYGFRDWRGGGRASARETIGRVAAGAVAKALLQRIGVEVNAEIIQVGKIKRNVEYENKGKKFEERYIEEIEEARKDGDSVGGVVEVVAKNVPVGLGEPVFNKLSADLAHALMTIPAAKGVEIGDGFACVEKKGSENNDELEMRDGKVRTKTNHAGGIVGGISNGEDIVLRVAFKPTSSIVKAQKTVDTNGQEVDIQVHGRHDPCVALRAPVIVEAMVALVLVDHYLLSKVNKI